jgi:hypothetical protein
VRIHSLFILVSISVITLACGNKRVDHLRFDYNEKANINYGYSFSFKTIVIYENGKEKDITNKQNLNLECFGATYEKGRIMINGYPERFSDDIIEVRASYESKGEIFKEKIQIPFNYNGQLGADFSGFVGLPGDSGKDGGTSILFRWGKDGAEGGPGSAGENGDNLHVYIWKDPESHKYKMIIENLNADASYYYSFIEKGFGILLSTNGGPGGQGGKGGSGGDGKDGEKTEKKTKSPGDGGHGGNGGDGGKGGNGGSVFVYIHPNAAEIQEKIAVYNFPGEGGLGGAGGSGGTAGKPLDEQDPANDGAQGGVGSQGIAGAAGAVIEFSIEEFEF